MEAFNILPPSVIMLQNDKTKFATAFRQHVHAHPFYSADELFMGKDDL
jgi:hypothetical protein